MEIKLKKQIETLEREITLKSVDLDEDIEDFNVDIHDFNDQEKLITISPRCVRCNLCVEECPINVISSSTWLKKAKIGEDCVQCEICAQTCPVSCIYVWDAESVIKEDDSVEYTLKEIKVPHRTLKMEDISINRNECIGCGSCLKYCPTNAISLRTKEFIEEHGEACPIDGAIDSEDGYVYFRQRLKRMIVTNGYNVYPGQLENIIDSVEEVSYSCVIGVPDQRRMHRVKAFVVLKDGCEPSDVIREKIMEKLRLHIAKYALPREIEFRRELPKTLVGKVAFRKLEEEEL